MKMNSVVRRAFSPIELAQMADLLERLICSAMDAAQDAPRGAVHDLAEEITDFLVDAKIDIDLLLERVAAPKEGV